MKTVFHNEWMWGRVTFFSLFLPQLVVHPSKRSSKEEFASKGKILCQGDPNLGFLVQQNHFKRGEKKYIKYANLKFSYGNSLKYPSLSYRSGQWIFAFLTLSLPLFLLRWDCNEPSLGYFIEGKPTYQYPVSMINIWSFKIFTSSQFPTPTSVG